MDTAYMRRLRIAAIVDAGANPGLASKLTDVIARLDALSEDMDQMAISGHSGLYSAPESNDVFLGVAPDTLQCLIILFQHHRWINQSLKLSKEDQKISSEAGYVKLTGLVSEFEYVGGILLQSLIYDFPFLKKVQAPFVLRLGPDWQIFLTAASLEEATVNISLIGVEISSPCNQCSAGDSSVPEFARSVPSN